MGRISADELAGLKQAEQDWQVIDGDTVRVGGQSYRLQGIDAPETSQPGGEAATRELLSRLQGRKAQFRDAGVDRYGRLLGRFVAEDGTDINAALVREGQAVAYSAFSNRYNPQEDAATAAGRGLHAGAFVEPSIYRQDPSIQPGDPGSRRRGLSDQTVDHWKDSPDVAWTDTLKAAFEVENPLFAAYDVMTAPDFDPVAGYEPLDDPLVQAHPDKVFALADAESPQEVRYRLGRLKYMAGRRAQVAREGVTGLAALGLAAVATPSSLMPFTRLLATSTRSGNALLAGAQTAPVVGAEELLLSASDPNRTTAEAALNIGLVTGVAGIIGGTAQRRATISADDLAEGPATAEARAAGATTSAEATVGRGAETIETEIRRWQDARASRPDAPPEPEDVTPDVPRQAGDTDLVGGLGMEKLPTNKRIRTVHSPIEATRKISTNLTGLGGLLRQENLRGIATQAGVSTEYAVRYHKPLVDALQEIKRQWLKSRGIDVPDSGPVTAKAMKQQASDLIRRHPESFEVFKERVSKAARRNDTDPDSPFVTAAAKSARELINMVGDEALKAGVYEKPLKTEIGRLVNELNELRAREVPDFAAEQDLKRRIAAAEAKIDRLRRYGFADLGDDESYLPGRYRQDKIDRDYEGLRQTLKREFLRTGADPKTVDDKVAQTIGRMRGSARSHEALVETGAGASQSARERTLEVSHKVIEDWMENDIEVLLRDLTQSIGMDTMLTARFGDIGMADVLKQIDDEVAARTPKLSQAEADKLRKRAERDKDDLIRIRDNLRGTGGLDLDPQSPLAKVSRGAMMANTMTMSGGFAISAIPDLGAMVVKQGLTNTLGNLYKGLFGQQAKLLRTMTAAELKQAGTMHEVSLSIMAAQFAEVGNATGRLSGWERNMQAATQAMFGLSGLNPMMDAIKLMTGIGVARQLDEAVSAVARGGATQDQLTRLANSGIDAKTARKIARQIEQHGETVSGQRMPNTASWTDETARYRYRAAVNQEVDNTIVSPDAADRANWTETWWGRMTAQFQSFAQAAQTKILTAGLQRRDRRFYEGVATMVALGAMVHEIKRLQYGESRPEDFETKMIHAIDRSGVTGIFGSMNQAMERLSNNNLGARNLLGQQGYEVTPTDAFTNAVSVGLGPTGHQAVALSRLGEDIVTNGISEDTFAQMRRFVPGQSLPALDPVMDRTLGD